MAVVYMLCDAAGKRIAGPKATAAELADALAAAPTGAHVVGPVPAPPLGLPARWTGAGFVSPDSATLAPDHAAVAASVLAMVAQRLRAAGVLTGPQAAALMAPATQPQPPTQGA